MAEPEIRYSPDGVPVGKEQGDPEEHLTDTPDFLARFDTRLVELGRRFGLNRHTGDRPAEDADQLEPEASSSVSSSTRVGRSGGGKRPSGG